jgi:hypothetical protein
MFTFIYKTSEVNNEQISAVFDAPLDFIDETLFSTEVRMC